MTSNELESFEKKLVRPDVHIMKAAIKIVLYLVVICVLSAIFYCVYASIRGVTWWEGAFNSNVKKNLDTSSTYYTVCFFYMSIIVCLLIRTKRIMIWCIKLYQRFAPDKMRLACVFEPSCSHYMIMAIEKYGVVKGVYKGIKRLARCKYPNGGIDFP